MASQDGHPGARLGEELHVNSQVAAKPAADFLRDVLVVQIDRDRPPIGQAYDLACSALTNSGFELVHCRSLAELGRRANVSDVACTLIPIMSNSLQPHVAALESLASVTPSLRRILIGPASLRDDTDLADFLLRGLIYDFISLPRDREALIATVRRAGNLAHIEMLGRRSPVDAQPGDSQMVGTSPVMRRVFEAIRKVSATRVPVLITGESGTGKELAARAIHDRSPVASGPFVAINCAGIPPTLIESELFGYEKGAFTGAAGRKIGRVETAHGGTLFLDEIGDMSLQVQAHLLRFLQEGTIQRVGGTKDIPVHARIIVATHVDLEKAVATGSFREDLYYRLRILTVELPALREREGDIELLANYFLTKFAADQGRCPQRLSKAAATAICRYGWPGNVRELIGAMRRATVMSATPLVRPEDLGIPRISEPEKAPPQTLSEVRTKAEEAAVRRALNYHAQNVQQTAQSLGISRVALYHLMRKYRLSSAAVASRRAESAARRSPPLRDQHK